MGFNAEETLKLLLEFGDPQEAVAKLAPVVKAMTDLDAKFREAQSQLRALGETQKEYASLADVTFAQVKKAFIAPQQELEKLRGKIASFNEWQATQTSREESQRLKAVSTQEAAMWKAYERDKQIVARQEADMWKLAETEKAAAEKASIAWVIAREKEAAAAQKAAAQEVAAQEAATRKIAALQIQAQKENALYNNPLMAFARKAGGDQQSAYEASAAAAAATQAFFQNPIGAIKAFAGETNKAGLAMQFLKQELAFVASSRFGAFMILSATIGGIAAGIYKAVEATAALEKAAAHVRSAMVFDKSDMLSVPVVMDEIALHAASMGQSFDDVSKMWWELKSAGLSTAESLKELDVAQKLVLVGAADAEQSTRMLAALTRQYGEEVGGVIAIGDRMAYFLNRSQVDMDGLIQGMKYASGNASLMGLSFDQTAATISVLNNHMLFGSKAGTSLAAELSKISMNAEEVNKRFGTHLDVTKGLGQQWDKMVSELGAKYKDNTLSLEQFAEAHKLVGERGGRAFAAMILGAKEYKDILDGAKQSTGDLDKATAEKMDTLSAQWGRFKAGLEGVAGLTGSAVLGLKPLIKTLADIEESYIAGVLAQDKFIESMKKAGSSSSEGTGFTFRNFIKGLAWELSFLAQGAETVADAIGSVIVAINTSSEGNWQGAWDALGAGKDDILASGVKWDTFRGKLWGAGQAAQDTGAKVAEAGEKAGSAANVAHKSWEALFNEWQNKPENALKAFGEGKSWDALVDKLELVKKALGDARQEMNAAASEGDRDKSFNTYAGLLKQQADLKREIAAAWASNSPWASAQDAIKDKIKSTMELFKGATSALSSFYQAQQEEIAKEYQLYVDARGKIVQIQKDLQGWVDTGFSQEDTSDAFTKGNFIWSNLLDSLENASNDEKKAELINKASADLKDVIARAQAQAEAEGGSNAKTAVEMGFKPLLDRLKELTEKYEEDKTKSFKQALDDSLSAMKNLEEKAKDSLSNVLNMVQDRGTTVLDEIGRTIDKIRDKLIGFAEETKGVMAFGAMPMTPAVAGSMGGTGFGYPGYGAVAGPPTPAYNPALEAPAPVVAAGQPNVTVQVAAPAVTVGPTQNEVRVFIDGSEVAAKVVAKVNTGMAKGTLNIGGYGTAEEWGGDFEAYRESMAQQGITVTDWGKTG